MLGKLGSRLLRGLALDIFVLVALGAMVLAPREAERWISGSVGAGTVVALALHYASAGMRRNKAIIWFGALSVAALSFALVARAGYSAFYLAAASANEGLDAGASVSPDAHSTTPPQQLPFTVDPSPPVLVQVASLVSIGVWLFSLYLGAKLVTSWPDTLARDTRTAILVVGFGLLALANTAAQLFLPGAP